MGIRFSQIYLRNELLDSSISGSTGMYNTSEEIVPGGFHENLEHVDFFEEHFMNQWLIPNHALAFRDLSTQRMLRSQTKWSTISALLGMNVKYNEKQTHFDEMNTFLMYTLAALVFLAFLSLFLLMREQIVSEQLTSLNHMKDRFLSIVVLRITNTTCGDSRIFWKYFGKQNWKNNRKTERSIR